jgi:hypothetical protein
LTLVVGLKACAPVVGLKACAPVEWIGQFHIFPLEITPPPYSFSNLHFEIFQYGAPANVCVQSAFL